MIIAKEFGASLFALGMLANILGLSFGITALPAGLIADRTGERNLLILCCLAMGVSAIAVGLSLNIYMLGLCFLVLGLALGIYHPTGAATIARIVRQRGVGFAYHGIGGNIGIALGPIMAGATASLLGWRAPYFIFAIPALILAAMIFFTTRGELSFDHRSPTNKVLEEKASLPPIILPLVLIFCAQVLNGFIYRGVVTFLPLYLSERINLAFLNVDIVLIAGSFTTLALAFGVLGQLLGGYLSERIRRETLCFTIALAVVPSLLTVGSSQGLILMLAAISFGFSYFMSQPVFNSLIADYSPSNWRGRMYGMAFFCSFGIGSFSAGILGYVADSLGTNWVFIVSAGFAVLALICTFILLVRASVDSRNRNTKRLL
jgi:MFS family permease